MAESIEQFVETLAWNCLNVESLKANPVYKTVFPTKDIFSYQYHAMKFSFHSDLLTILEAPSSPSLSWLQTLPSVSLDQLLVPIWGVYLLRLESIDPKQPVFIYIGSGTEATRGLKTRLHQHMTDQCPPSLVDALKKQDYEITKISILAQCPIPTSAPEIPYKRLVVVAVEAAFTCGLWALPSDGEYGFGNFALWSKDSFAYRGASSHNPLNDTIKGFSTFEAKSAEVPKVQSAKALEEEAAREEIRKEKQKASKAKWRLENKEEQKASNAKWRLENKEKQKASNAKWKSENRERTRAYSAKYRKKEGIAEETSARCAKWRLENKEKAGASSAKWASENKEKRRAYKAKWDSEKKEKSRAYKA